MRHALSCIRPVHWTGILLALIACTRPFELNLTGGPTPVSIPAPTTTPPAYVPPTAAPTPPPVLTAAYLGQDGSNHAGRECSPGSAADNIHIHLDGLRADVQPTAFRVEDRAGGGVWVGPCNSSNWMAHVSSLAPGGADLFFKPFREAPDGTAYTITVQYEGGVTQTATVTGQATRTVLGALFLGQDGSGFAGRGCASSAAPDNAHIRLDGMRTDAKPISFRVDDAAGRGHWASPCKADGWLLHAVASDSKPGEADLYFKPFRDAPDGTLYAVSVQYDDGLPQTASVVGSRIYPVLTGVFLGQDGKNSAGRKCASGTSADNVHVHLDGLRTDVLPTAFKLEDRAGGGTWANPCDPNSNWMLRADLSPRPGEADLYFKPFRDAPDGTLYALTVQYGDGTFQSATLTGKRVNLILAAAFMGQDGKSFAGPGCIAGTAPDNAHIHLDGLRLDARATSYRVEDLGGNGAWVSPCAATNWLLHTVASVPGEADLYFKPFRDAPDGTEYAITIQYDNGSVQSAGVIGTRIRP